jgi:hypothetical protein
MTLYPQVEKCRIADNSEGIRLNTEMLVRLVDMNYKETKSVDGMPGLAVETATEMMIVTLISHTGEQIGNRRQWNGHEPAGMRGWRKPR